MKNFFDEETNKKLLEAKTIEEVQAIITGTPYAEKYLDKADLILKEIDRIRSGASNEYRGLYVHQMRTCDRIR